MGIIKTDGDTLYYAFFNESANYCYNPRNEDDGITSTMITCHRDYTFGGDNDISCKSGYEVLEGLNEIVKKDFTKDCEWVQKRLYGSPMFDEQLAQQTGCRIIPDDTHSFTVQRFDETTDSWVTPQEIDDLKMEGIYPSIAEASGDYFRLANPSLNTEEKITIAMVNESRVICDLSILDHSGVSMKIGDSWSCDPVGWDVSKIGFIVSEPLKENTPENREKMKTTLSFEIDNYDKSMQGIESGVLVFENGELVDSCFFPTLYEEEALYEMAVGCTAKEGYKTFEYIADDWDTQDIKEFLLEKYPDKYEIVEKEKVIVTEDIQRKSLGNLSAEQEQAKAHNESVKSAPAKDKLER